MAWYVNWRKLDGSIEETLHDDLQIAKDRHQDWARLGRDVWIADHRHRRINLELPMNEHVKALLEWCYVERQQAEEALALYESGRMWFRINNVDATEEQKTSLGRIIDEHTKLIGRIEADSVIHES